MVIVLVLPTPSVKIFGVIVNVGGGITLTWALTLAIPAPLAVMTELPKLIPETTKLALSEPAGTTRLVCTEATDGTLDTSVTFKPPTGAGYGSVSASVFEKPLAIELVLGVIASWADATGRDMRLEVKNCPAFKESGVLSLTDKLLANVWLANCTFICVLDTNCAVTGVLFIRASVVFVKFLPMIVSSTTP